MTSKANYTGRFSRFSFLFLTPQRLFQPHDPHGKHIYSAGINSNYCPATAGETITAVAQPLHLFRVSHLTTLKRTKSFPGFVNDSGTKRRYVWVTIYHPDILRSHSTPRPITRTPSRMIVTHFLYISSSLVAGWFYCTPFVLYTFIVRLCSSLKRNIKKETSVLRLFPLSCGMARLIGSTMRFIASRWYFYWTLTRTEDFSLCNKNTISAVFICAHSKERGTLLMHMRWTRGWSGRVYTALRGFKLGCWAIWYGNYVWIWEYVWTFEEMDCTPLLPWPTVRKL